MSSATRNRQLGHSRRSFSLGVMGMGGSPVAEAPNRAEDTAGILRVKTPASDHGYDINKKLIKYAGGGHRERER